MDIVNEKRVPSLVTARHVAWFLERRVGRSYSEIARLYNREHSTVIAAVNHMEERVAANDTRYVEAVESITARLSVAAKEVGRRRVEQAHAVLDDLSCPTCGAPVLRELQRQIAELRQQVQELGANGAHGRIA